MSSEISIEAGALKGKPGAAAPSRVSPGEPGSRPDEGFRPWHFFLLVSILLATVGVMLARQSSPENLILISLTIAAAGTAAAAFYRMLAPLTQPFVVRTGEPVTERARAALEREKMLVLRSIKDLEFDRAMGKLSQKDFDEMSGRLRTRALSLMRQLDVDTAGYQAAIESELNHRLERRFQPGPGKASPRPSGTVPADAPAAECTCPSCAAENDADAVFCKKCGTRMSA
jgi:hypothetical protein